MKDLPLVVPHFDVPGYGASEQQASAAERAVVGLRGADGADGTLVKADVPVREGNPSVGVLEGIMNDKNVFEGQW